MTEAQSLTLKDGRALSYATYGAPLAGAFATVFYFHGTPGTHCEGEGVHASATEKALHIVAVSRPGYAGSTFQPDRTILSFADDVLALADHLKIQQFAVLGISGGGPYVFACMHAFPERVLCGAAVASIYPTELGTGGMKFGNRMLLAVAPRAPGLVSFTLDWALGGKLARDDAHPEKFVEAFREIAKNLPPEDRAAMEVDGGKWFDVAVMGTREGLRNGGQAGASDMKLYGRPWGFELASLKVKEGKLSLWHGAKDANVPVSMAQAAAKMIPGAVLNVSDQAHLSCSVMSLKDVVSWLAATAEA
ncbi:alpha/beta-hydrolase [Thozetella sp. PMI_491]|nr:alpha/beta-hydrolase [Thozetella sp. PMI_491]